MADWVLSDRFEVRERIGIGGMCMVHRCFDRLEQVERAVKMLLPQTAVGPKARRRFTQEAETMASLDHPNITRVSHVGEDRGTNYFVMTLAQNSIAGLMKARNRALGAREATSAAIQMLRGLHYAHGRGVVHRDVKPANILIGPQGRILLADFGIARLLETPEHTRITGNGDTLGTIAYMPPEQRLDPRNAGTPADIYATGTTLYFLVTGRRPLDLTLASLDPTMMQRVPELLHRPIERATRFDPYARWASAAEMADALEAVWDRLPETDPAELVTSEDDRTVVHIAPPR